MVHQLENPEIILHGLNDVETVANALSLYIENMTKEFADAEPRPLTGPWHDYKDPLLFAGCLHNDTVDVTTFDVNTPSARDIMCIRCGATQTTIDALDAVRGTLRDAIELRQRIVKEWGYDPTHG